MQTSLCSQQGLILVSCMCRQQGLILISCMCIALATNGKKIMNAHAVTTRLMTTSSLAHISILRNLAPRGLTTGLKSKVNLTDCSLQKFT